MKLPLLIGGATTSRIHTAVRIEQKYTQPVIHVKDASRSVSVVSQLLSKDNKEGFVSGIREEYRELRDNYKGAGDRQKYVTLEQARKNMFRIDWDKSPVYRPSTMGIQVLNDYPIAEIREYISWIFFFLVWQLRGKWPDILEDPRQGEEARRLYEDAVNMLDWIQENNALRANAVFGFFPANSVGDDIEVYSDEEGSEVISKFINLRNQQSRNDKAPNPCLSDFLAPRSSGKIDYLGVFAVTAGLGIEEHLETFARNHDDYSSIMLKAVADRLAEGFTELLHKKIRREYWGYTPEENMGLDDLILEKYQGIRPAHGYPACPDHSEKEAIFKLLDVPAKTGIQLTENHAMFPAASVSGLIFAHPESRYFFVDKIGKDQVENYARRKNVSIATVEKWLASNLNYK